MDPMVFGQKQNASTRALQIHQPPALSAHCTPWLPAQSYIDQQDAETTKQSHIRGMRCQPYVFSLAEQSQTKNWVHRGMAKSKWRIFSHRHDPHQASLDAAGGGTSLTLRRSASNSSCQSGRVTMNQRWCCNVKSWRPMEEQKLEAHHLEILPTFW